MEQKIMEVLRRMQSVMQENQMRELKNVLNIVFAGCEIIEETSVRVIDKSWEADLEDFLVSKALEGKSIETVQRYRYELKRLLSYINKAVADVTAGDISEYMRAYKYLRNVSNQTLQNVRAVYSSFFGWMRDRDRVRKNPMALVESVKTEKILKKPYSDEEREKLLRNCKTLRDKAMMEFLYSTAVRVSELARLNREDIHFSSKDLVVWGKGAKERRVYLNDRTNMYMREYLQSRTDAEVALFVSIKSPHERLTKAGIEDIIRRVGKRAQVEKAHPHRFRRTAATNALNRGMPVQEVAEFLGHANLQTTMRYCTVSQDSVQYHHRKYLSA
ncbi:tyrosine-type recombinase/integrase [Mediterraneibacter sp. NSJ-55]|uniref:Tyrosine-type recombinase/integrase n=1 Tax=Mediterraneibacter hominis TaxID=2763054 RepID=A0A923RQP2_9FIRM|nr:tyrosine-type recombinase/integrase [Mediterraneibacter hominis]MBC5689789.1 tyrosine-type recombinase/integrase [Mediterraneibacter hominis]